MLSIITPIDLSRRSDQILRRIVRLLEAIQGADIEVVLGHADRNFRADSRLKKLVASRSKSTKVVLSSIATTDLSTNLSRLRNEAARFATGDVVLLLDIDIFPDIALFQYMENYIKSTPAGFCMVPCVYLTSEGSEFLLGGGNQNFILERFYRFRSNFVMHWACPSSIVAFYSGDYWRIGGFYEGFEGHGYEDFDFILRLLIDKSLIQKSPNLLVDNVYQAPGFSTGFRSVLARFCVDNIFDSKMAFHLFHAKDKNEVYYLRRVDNKRVFLDRLSALCFDKMDGSNSSLEAVYPFLCVFYNECVRRGERFEDYLALFDARPRFTLKNKSWVSAVLNLYRKFLRRYD